MTLRTFIAVEIPPEAQEKLSRLQQQVKIKLPPNSVRWTVVANIHLTLHFLGNISPDEVLTVGRLLNDIATVRPAFSLTLSGLGYFPNQHKPRIIWAGIKGETEPLITLQQMLGEQLQTEIGFTPESRPYSPHLTLGRVKQELARSQLAELSRTLIDIQANVGDLAEFNVTEVVLMKSELKPSGPIYTPLMRSQLIS